MSIFGDIGSLFGGSGSTQNNTPLVNPNSTLDQNASQYGGQVGGAATRQGQLSALGAAGASQAGQAPYQAAQLSALQQAQNEANGQDFGATQAALNQGLAQGQAGAASMAAGARGGGAGLAAAQNAAGASQAGQAAATASNAASMKAQMQQQGVQNLNSFASGGLGQQMQQNMGNAQLQQGYEGMNNQIGLAQQQQQMNMQQLMSQNTLASQGQQSQQGAGNAAQNSSLFSGLLGTGASVGSAIASSSDARGKHSVQGESGGRYMSSPVEAKTGIENAGTMPGMSTGMAGTAGQAQLANMDSHIANFGKESKGMQVWTNESMAKPWSPASTAAQENANHFFFSSDEGGKTAASPESAPQKTTGEQVGAAIGTAGDAFSKSMGGGDKGQHDIDPIHGGYHSIWKDVTSDTRAKKAVVKEDALKEAAAQLSGQVDDSNLKMAMRPTAIESVAWDKAHPRAPSEPSAADQYMATARPFTYDYKNPAENGGERRLGIMAQDLERGPTGSDLVKDTPRGKVVDVPALASANSAAVGRLHDRVSALEQSQGSAGDDRPAWAANDVPRLEAPPPPAIYDAYGGGVRLGDDDPGLHVRSDTKAKKDAIFQSGVAAGARQMAPDTREVTIKHSGDNSEANDAWRRAIVAPDRMPAHHAVDLPPPPLPLPPPLQSPEQQRTIARLADYNAQADASMRAAAAGSPTVPVEEHEDPDGFEPATAMRGPQTRSSVFAPQMRAR